jgi:hypothetical protein
MRRPHRRPQTENAIGLMSLRRVSFVEWAEHSEAHAEYEPRVKTWARRCAPLPTLLPLMKTSRAHVDRLLDPDNGNATIESLQRAARIVGRELRMQLV